MCITLVICINVSTLLLVLWPFLLVWLYTVFVCYSCFTYCADNYSEWWHNEVFSFHSVLCTYGKLNAEIVCLKCLLCSVYTRLLINRQINTVQSTVTDFWCTVIFSISNIFWDQLGHKVLVLFCTWHTSKPMLFIGLY